MTMQDRIARGRDEAILDAARQRRAEFLWFLLRDRPWVRNVEAFDSPISPAFLGVFLPLASGYLLAYVFRTINGPLADELIRRFSLDAGSLGLLTSIYFLAFALSAVPIGVALDLFGPRSVQGWLMTVAAIGALVFALSPNAIFLFVGRAMIGVGVAGSLMAGLKAHALWMAPRYLPLANGGLVMFGGLGAIAATLPIGMVDGHIGWRGTFVILAFAAMSIAVLVFLLLPKHQSAPERASWRDVSAGFINAITDRRFIRIAPLSASVVGTAFAIHGLWAARWLTDIDRFQPPQVLQDLMAMGVGLTLGALVIGAATTFLSRLAVPVTKIFGGFCLVFIVLELLLQANMGVPPMLLWGLIGGFGGMSVLSYSILDAMFAKAVIGRANSALNVLHLTTAWAVQAAMGLVIARWSSDLAGHYPLVSYRVAFLMPLALQVAALVWFFWFEPTTVSSAEGPCSTVAAEYGEQEFEAHPERSTSG